MFLKVFLRLVVPVTAVYLFFVCGFFVSAEEDAAGEEKQYKTSISFYYNSLGNMSGGTDSFTVVSGKPFYMFYRYTEEPACYPMYFCGDLEDFIALRDSVVFGFQSSLSGCSVSGTRINPDGVTVLYSSLFSSATVYMGTTRATLTASCPVFDSADSLQRYLESGDESGITNKDDLKASVSRSLPYLRNVTWHINPNCYGSSPKVVGDEFSWDTSGIYPAAVVEVKADVTIHFGGTDSPLDVIAGKFKLDLKDTVNIITYDGKTGLPAPAYDSGYLLVPDDKLRQAVLHYVGTSTEFSPDAVNSVSVTSYYLRMVFYDESENVLHVGGWTKVNVNGALSSAGDFITTGDFDPDTGEYVQDITSDGSYSYGTNIDGSYDFDGSGAPKDIGEAFTMFLQIMQLLFSYMGKVPELIKRVYGFLPPIFNWMIGALLFVAFILRILGR